MLRTILALRSIANHFLGVFQRGDPPEPPPQILGKSDKSDKNVKMIKKFSGGKRPEK